MEPMLEILQDLHKISQSEKPVGMITIYKNIPLLFDAKIMAFNEAAVDFQVHRYQWEASKHTHEVYLQSDQLSNTVVAKSVTPKAFNAKEEDLMITLTGFDYSRVPIIRRSLVRVEPDEPMPIIILFNGNPIKAELIDISNGGLSVSLKPEAIESLGGVEAAPQQGNIEVIIKLPVEHEPLLKLSCAIRDVQETAEKGKYRMGLAITPDKAMGRFLNRYINDRKKTIVHELDAITNFALRR